MTKKLTPQEACELGSKLWGKPLTLKRSPTQPGRTDVYGDDGAFRFDANFNIDWGDLWEWPLKEPERKWRDARMPEDWGKPARFRHYDGDWSDGVLVGYIVSDCVWLDHPLCAFDECQVEDIPAQAETPPNNYMLEALRSALNTLDKGMRVRFLDQWPAFSLILPETIQKVKDAIERAEADLGAQKKPSSVAKIQAETKAVTRDLQNVGSSEQHPADREPTDEEVERVCQLRYGRAWQEMWGIEQAHKEHESKLWLKAWQQVWRESK